MPKLNSQMMPMTTANQYQFTATRIEDLGASEYTLVTILMDTSSSVATYRDALVACVKSVHESCERHPRSDLLMLRLCTFDDHLKEVHGFRETATIDRSDYNTAIKIRGCTALYEAAFEGIDATLRYGGDLSDLGYCINALIFVVTDGMDNRSKKKPDQIAKLLKRYRLEERLTGLTTILIGVTDNQIVSNSLADFRKEAHLDHYVDLGDASPDALAKLAGLMSQSISMASMSLGSGGAGAISLQI